MTRDADLIQENQELANNLRDADWAYRDLTNRILSIHEAVLISLEEPKIDGLVIPEAVIREVDSLLGSLLD